MERLGFLFWCCGIGPCEPQLPRGNEKERLGGWLGSNSQESEETCLVLMWVGKGEERAEVNQKQEEKSAFLAQGKSKSTLLAFKGMCRLTPCFMMLLFAGYDFPAVLQWFAERVDLIILLFDAHKLEISDEFSEAIRALKGNEDKIRVVLNKADMVETQQLMRVYGALMWSLGKVFNTPEVLRVYIGSFWSEPLMISDNRRLFELEEQDLFTDIQNLPRNSALRKLNDLVKRARLVRVHAHIISHLKREMPSVFGKENKKKQLINKLPVIFAKIQLEHHISPGDFPDCNKMQEMLMVHDFTKFHGLKPRMVDALDELLTLDIAKLMPLLRQEETEVPEQIVHGGAFDGTRNGPFIEGATEGAYEGMDEDEWVVTKDKPKYDEIFYNLSPMDGKLSGTKAKNWMVTTKLPNSVLGKIWKLSDVDRDGMLDDEEFALASHLIEVKLDGHGLPSDLPRHLVPPSKRRQKGSAE
uniref:EH domain containing 2 n=1 Tax=Anolis carolinensis TaxID=28377 RepID=A0A803TPR3_ANOCA